MKKALKEINWKYAIGELLLIFLGITMAIWFNNWNETQKSNKTELKSIQEIKNAIRQDLVDINENISGFGKRVYLYELILEHIDGELPLSDTLKYHLPYMQGVTTFLSNIGPYETLKSRGLETITNDSIRLKISLYYDFEYEKIQTNERQHYEHYINNMKPLIIQKFNLKGYALEPLDYDQLIHDLEFKQTILWALRTDSYMLELYVKLRDIGESLVQELETEIQQLQ
ncbi:DUF6090 family protein [Spongiimicrobium salis]|uniref:DUF6090 family protein n=1 Tax=Spongiimicrobium salis TaxID=1667022 RepID=UPI00374D1576